MLGLLSLSTTNSRILENSFFFELCVSLSQRGGIHPVPPPRHSQPSPWEVPSSERSTPVSSPATSTCWENHLPPSTPVVTLNSWHFNVFLSCGFCFCENNKSGREIHYGSPPYAPFLCRDLVQLGDVRAWTYRGGYMSRTREDTTQLSTTPPFLLSGDAFVSTRQHSAAQMLLHCLEHQSPDQPNWELLLISHCLCVSD